MPQFPFSLTEVKSCFKTLLIINHVTKKIRGFLYVIASYQSLEVFLQSTKFFQKSFQKSP